MWDRLYFFIATQTAQVAQLMLFKWAEQLGQSGQQKQCSHSIKGLKVDILQIKWRTKEQQYKMHSAHYITKHGSTKQTKKNKNLKDEET